ncbi:hypothetical protein [Cryobacterium sp. CAN_C2]|uniref:hypothetical protein n=1 Tax=Cryobacterium sp. CAN_C2 TaxID=2787723 RepID=UPI0018CA5F03
MQVEERGSADELGLVQFRNRRKLGVMDAYSDLGMHPRGHRGILPGYDRLSLTCFRNAGKVLAIQGDSEKFDSVCRPQSQASKDRFRPRLFGAQKICAPREWSWRFDRAAATSREPAQPQCILNRHLSG